MKVQILIDGEQRLRERMIQLADKAKTDKFVRKGMSDAARLVARAQQNMAPVRPVRVKKFRSIGKVKTAAGYVRPDGPLRFIPPGLLKRSIGFRVKKEKGTGGSYSVVIGANVGKKKKNPNNAPHAAFVGSGTVQRYSNGRQSARFHGPTRVNRGIMPANPYISIATNFAAPAALKALEAGVQAEIAAEVARS